MRNIYETIYRNRQRRRRSSFPLCAERDPRFSHLLEGRATQITEEMKLAASLALASLVPDDELNEDNILPEAFDPRVADVVSAAVKEHIHE